MTTIIIIIILYIILGLFVSTYVMWHELGFGYTNLNDFIITIIGAMLWPILLALVLMCLGIHYIYKLLCLG